MSILAFVLLAAIQPEVDVSGCLVIKDKVSQQHCIDSTRAHIAAAVADGRMNVPDGNRKLRPEVEQAIAVLRSAVAARDRSRIGEFITQSAQMGAVTPYERYALARNRVAAFANLNDDASMMEELEKLKWDGHLTGKERDELMLNLARLQYNHKLFEKAKYSAMEASGESAPNLDALEILVLSEYRMADYFSARTDADKLIAERRKRGEPVTQRIYKTSMAASLQLKEDAAYDKVLQMAVRDYPEEFGTPAAPKETRSGGFMDGLMGALDFGSRVVTATATQVAAQRESTGSGVAWSQPATPVAAAREPVQPAPAQMPAAPVTPARGGPATSPQVRPQPVQVPSQAARQANSGNAQYFSGPLACVSAPSTYSVSLCPGAISAKVTNRCSEPIDVRLCHRTVNGVWDCGVGYGVRPGASWSYPSCRGSGQTFSDARFSTDKRALSKPP